MINMVSIMSMPIPVMVSYRLGLAGPQRLPRYDGSGLGPGKDDVPAAVLPRSMNFRCVWAGVLPAKDHIFKAECGQLIHKFFETVCAMQT